MAVQAVELSEGYLARLHAAKHGEGQSWGGSNAARPDGSSGSSAGGGGSESEAEDASTADDFAASMGAGAGENESNPPALAIQNIMYKRFIAAT